MNRTECKYLISIDKLDFIRDQIAGFVEMDSYAKRNGGNYTVRSIYFDSKSLAFYNEKVEGLHMRKKLRIRGYNQEEDNSINFLEIKRRYGTPIYKNRAPIFYKNTERFLNTGNFDLIENFSGFPNARGDASRFLYQLNRWSLRPVVNVVYDREAYVGRFDRTVRLTFDMNLRSKIFPQMSQLYGNDQLRYAFKKHFILEIKFFGVTMPVWGRTLVQALAGKQQALSKYCICIETHEDREFTSNYVVSQTKNRLDEYDLNYQDFEDSQTSKSSILYPIIP